MNFDKAKFVVIDSDKYEIEDSFSLGETGVFNWLEDGNVFLNLDGICFLGQTILEPPKGSIIFSEDGQDGYGFNYSLDLYKDNGLFLDFAQNGINFVFKCDRVIKFELE